MLERPQPRPDAELKRRGRVLLICPGGLESLGGIARVMGYLVDRWRATPAASPRFTVIDNRGPGRAIWSPLYVARAVLQIVWLRATGRVWLMHVNISDGLSLARKAVILATARLLRIPVVLHSHGATFPQTYDRLPGFAQRHVRAMYRSAAALIVLGEGFRRYFIDALGVAPEKVVVLDNAVPRPAHPGVPAAGPCRILFLGGLSERKGVPELLQALASPEVEALDWSATLAGGGPVARFQAMAAELGLGDRCRLPGWLDRDATAALLGASDLLVLPSHDEGLPIAILEALSYGLPVLTTPVGAIPEVLEDGRSAVLVPPGDVPALAAALARLVTDPAFRARIAAGGAALFDRRFAIDSFVAGLLAIYRRAAP